MKLCLATCAFSLWFVRTRAAPGAPVQSLEDPPVIKDGGNLSRFDPPQVETAVKTRKAFSLSQVHNERHQPIDAPTALIKAHTKYGRALPPRLQKAIEINPDLNTKFKALLQDGGSIRCTLSL